MKRSGLSNLDEAIGGFTDGKAVLVYGPSGSGKTAFSLSFLKNGLENGENAVLITSEHPEQVLDMSDVYGWSLKPYLLTRKLRIFEYPANIDQITAGASDLSQVVAELRKLLGDQAADRIVFDPITALIEGNGNATLHRCRSVLDPIARMGAAVFILMDSSTPGPVLGYCKDLSSTTLRLTPASDSGGPRFLRVERHRDKRDAERLYHFDLQPGVGFIPVDAPIPVVPKLPNPARPRLQEAETHRHQPSPRPAPTPLSRNDRWPYQLPAPQPMANSSTALVIDANATRRQDLRGTLQRSFNVLEACGMTDAMTLLAAGSPQAIVLALDPEEENGTEVVCNLRQTGCNLPIIGISSRTLTLSDHTNALAAGTDVCLAFPVDARILRLTVFNAICRHGMPRRAEQVAPARAPSYSQHVTFTSDVSALLKRLAREVAYAQQQQETFIIATMRMTGDPLLKDQAASLASSLLRPADGVFVGQNGIACLLVESTAPESFLNVFSNYWTAGPAPQFNLLRFDGRDGFLDVARDFVGEEIGEVSENAWAAAAHAGVANGRYVTLEPAFDNRTYPFPKSGYSHD